MKRAKQDWLIVLGLSVIVFLFWSFWRWSEPGFFLSDDNGNYFLGTYLYTYQSVVKKHTLPLVNYHQYLGNIHLGQGQSAVFYPLLYLAFFISELIWKTPVWGIDVLVLIHWWLAAVGMYLLLKQLTIKNNLAILGSLLYLSFPYVVGVSRIWIVIPYWLAYLPWNFWALNRFMKKPSKSNSLILGVIKLMLVLQGYIQWVVTSLFLELAYLLIRFWQTEKLVTNWWKQKWLVTYAVIWMVVAMLGAPVLLPLYQSAQRSLVRSGQVRFSDFMKVTVAPGDFLAAQLMQFRKGVIFDGTTYIYHVGLVVLGAWLMLVVMSKHWKTDAKALWWRWSLLTLLSLACASGLYALAFYVPVLNWFRWPFKYLLPFEFFLTVSLVVGMNNFFNNKPRGFLVNPGVLSSGLLMIGIVSNFVVMNQNKSVTNSFSQDRVRPPIETGWQKVIDGKRGRVISYGIDFDGSENQVNLGTYNFATVNGYYSFLGYDATIARGLWEAVRGTAEFGVNKDEVNEETLKYLRNWGVRYWVSDNTNAISKMQWRYPLLKEIYNQGGIVVLEDSRALPLVYWSDGNEAKFEFKPNGIRVITGGKSGQLTFNVFGWPEYKITGDETGIEIEGGDNRITVTVLAGVDEIKSVYVDNSLRLGLFVAAIAMVGIVVCGLVSWKFGGVFERIRGRG